MEFDDGFGKLVKIIIPFCMGFVMAMTSATAQAQGRIRPPDSITCDYNHLTSFTGRVLSYKRAPGRVSLRMRTDEATTESFTLRFSRSENAAKYFLLHGESFKQSDWALIERSRSTLRPRMRATVWVCDDRSTPIVDWRPGEDRTQTTY